MAEPVLQHTLGDTTVGTLAAKEMTKAVQPSVYKSLFAG
jgi:hypothetical protein